MKHDRIIIKQLREMFPGLEAVRVRHRTHCVYELKLRGTVRHLAISASPKNTDHAIVNAVKEAKRLLGVAR